MNAFQQFAALCSGACDSVTGVRQPSRQRHRQTERQPHNQEISFCQRPDQTTTCACGLISFKSSAHINMHTGTYIIIYMHVYIYRKCLQQIHLETRHTVFLRKVTLSFLEKHFSSFFFFEYSNPKQ